MRILEYALKASVKVVLDFYTPVKLVDFVDHNYSNNYVFDRAI